LNRLPVPFVPAKALAYAHMLGHERERSVRGAKNGAAAFPPPMRGRDRGGGYNKHSGCFQSNVGQMPLQDF